MRFSYFQPLSDYLSISSSKGSSSMGGHHECNISLEEKAFSLLPVHISSKPHREVHQGGTTKCKSQEKRDHKHTPPGASSDRSLGTFLCKESVCCRAGLQSLLTLHLGSKGFRLCEQCSLLSDSQKQQKPDHSASLLELLCKRSKSVKPVNMTFQGLRPMVCSNLELAAHYVLSLFQGQTKTGSLLLTT